MNQGDFFRQLILWVNIVLIAIVAVLAVLNFIWKNWQLDDVHRRAIISAATVIICCLSAYVVFLEPLSK